MKLQIYKVFASILWQSANDVSFNCSNPIVSHWDQPHHFFGICRLGLTKLLWVELSLTKLKATLKRNSFEVNGLRLFKNFVTNEESKSCCYCLYFLSFSVKVQVLIKFPIRGLALLILSNVIQCCWFNVNCYAPKSKCSLHLKLFVFEHILRHIADLE